jgi:hypothetical protein
VLRQQLQGSKENFWRSDMKKITNRAGLTDLKRAFWKIFSSKDPFDTVFQETIEHKILLFPTVGYYLQDVQFDALIQAIEEVGESTFHVSEIEGDCFTKSSSDQAYEQGHWNCTTQLSYEEYLNIPLVLENAIYSPSGKWGVLLSHEGHAVVGGGLSFIRKFQSLYPQHDTCSVHFIEQWSHNEAEFGSNLDWVKNFLKQFS